MTNILIFGDSGSLALRHEVPLGVPDQVAYAEVDGRRIVMAPPLEVARLSEIDGIDVIPLSSLGLEDLIARGHTMDAATYGAVANGLLKLEVDEIVVPAEFPLELADLLRTKGIAVVADGPLFNRRRRSKSPAELAGLRRGMQTAALALAAIRERIRSDEATDADELRAVANRVYAERNAVAHEMTTFISCGPQSANPHNPGKGPILAGQPIILDIYPRDLLSGCWGDFARTFCLGSAPDWLKRAYGAVKEAQRRAIDAVRPGVTGEELFRIAAEYLSEEGYPTRLSSPDNTHPNEGFAHPLGHGVGLGIHEPPWLDLGGEELVVGDVVTIEPGLYFKDKGAARVEDMVLVTESGHENLTEFPYDLEI